ncbi:MAG TPA: allantoate amidohydrolase [Alphaproteobacteria bacterium]|jgi:allantoate deiminase|nr:allantoate amidohydrolase [Alphaproteobacteria bacterium]
MGPEICRRIDELAAISESPDRLTRIFLSAEQAQASRLVLGWMHDAGMETRIDAIGNVVGRYEGVRPGLPALVMGSHLDTVRDAGKYDGMLGVIAAIACIAELNRAGRRLDFAVTVIGFSDEEGVRFGTTMLGSEAVAGTFDRAALSRTDDCGLTMDQALRAYGLDPERIGEAALRREDVLAYVEFHIEQGPVLEGWGLPVGCVTSISGATRYEVTIGGEAGHAGTVPMTARKDALAAAAECVLAVETRCAGEQGLVGTVGRIEARPGAINVIPGHAVFTIDVRAPEDEQRVQAADDVLRQLDAIAAKRGVTLTARKIYDMAATPCAPWLMGQIDGAIADQGITPFHLPSGAGHDGMAMIAVADIGMIFLRCEKGISHNPAEAITVDDAETGARVLLRFIENFQASA